MHILGNILEFLDADMPTPASYGFFHLFFFALSIIVGIVLCRVFPEGTQKQTRRILLIASVMSIVLEIYKQINYTFSYDGTAITADYLWYAFPFQFCSTPMYVGALACMTKGRVHKACCAYLATFSVFAGLCVMFYPAQVFISTIGINIQTMLCHGAMITLGIYLLMTGYVKAEHKTVLRAVPVFAVCIVIAMVLNEIAYRTGLTQSETFNMFFISPYCDPSLPVYSLVQQAVAYPWCLLIYIGCFTLAAYIVLLLFMGIKKIVKRKTT